VEAFEDLPRDQTGEFFLHLSSRDQAGLLLALPPGERRVWLRLLPPDDTADVLQFAPGEELDGLAAQLDEVTRREVNALLAYKEDAAGGLMNPHFARLRRDMTIDDAISYLRHQASHVETIYYVYALDEEQRLLGVVNFRDLFADQPKSVRDIMRTKFVSVSEQMDQEAVARLFSKFHLLAIPVLDADDRMQGIVTADD
jgi:magnesium transporter